MYKLEIYYITIYMNFEQKYIKYKQKYLSIKTKQAVQLPNNLIQMN